LGTIGFSIAVRCYVDFNSKQLISRWRSAYDPSSFCRDQFSGDQDGI
jgi:hypothetical protein